MTFVVSHPTGNTFVKALVEELHDNDLLCCFFTTIGFGNQCYLPLTNINKKRKYNIPDKKVNRLWYPELKRLLIKSSQENNRRLADLSYTTLDSKTSKEFSAYAPKIIHAYEDGASQQFRKAKDFGIKCSYELPIAYWQTSRRLLMEEAQRHPSWEPTLEATCEPEEKLLKKEQELILADRITCPSKFVLNSIPTRIRDNIPCQVAPFGSPINAPTFNITEKDKKKDFNILFVGSMSQRKGLADLFEAMKLLKKEPVELSILGQPSMSMEFYRKQFKDFKYYEPCSNDKVCAIMKEHDALVLPSIIEGRALVQQEALSCGIPIIVTENAGGKDLINEGITGHLVPIRSPEKIAEKIQLLLDSNSNKKDIAEECMKKAKSYSWSAYAKSIIEFNLNFTAKLL